MALQLRNLFSPSCVQQSLSTSYRLTPAMIQYQSFRSCSFTSSPYTPLATSVRWTKPLQHPIVSCSALSRAELGSAFRIPLQFKGWATYSSHSGKSKEIANKVSKDTPKRKGSFFALYNSLNGKASTTSASKSKKATIKTTKDDKTVSKIEEEEEASINTKTISKEKKKAFKTSSKAEPSVVSKEKKKASRAGTSQTKIKADAENPVGTLSKTENSSTAKKKRVSISAVFDENIKASENSASQTKADAEDKIPNKTLSKAKNSSTVKKKNKSTSISSTKEVAVPDSSKISSKAKKSSESASSTENLVKTSTVRAKAKKTRTGEKKNIAKTSSSGMGSSRTSSKSKASDTVAESVNGPVKRGRAHDFRPLYPPTGKSVVVVESVTKAKVIQKYLGNMYEVVPSYGHVRDLAGRSRSVRPDEDFSVVWEVPHAAWTHLKSIRDALNGADNLILASDPDREGEAIAWHVVEMLHQQDALTKDIAISRVVFHEITESSIKAALQSPRDIDMDLIYAYLARRAIDYLIGFNISPVLWRKLPGCPSAGRVQSAALALICDRENEIEQFKPAEYWTIESQFWAKNRGFNAHLTHFGKEKLNQLSVCSEEKAREIEGRASSSKFEVLSKKTSKVSRNPPLPYITSTLQQDSGNKLLFSASYTMKLAQKLYEGVKLSDGEATGLITYMRTDGFHISEGAAEDIVSFVKERYGGEFASSGVRKYSKKVKNAQEAHEAIRPTNIRRLPSTLRGVLDEDAIKLYSLIWARTMACQMDPGRNNIIQVDIGTADKDMIFRSAASTVDFLGYRAVYEDKEVGPVGTNSDEDAIPDKHYEVLHELKVRESIKLGELNLGQHFTKPPPRYSEGALVKKLEQLGIGRPSTYAVTIRVLLDRNYVTMKSRALHPEFRGRMVSAFLAAHFSEVTDYSFTAGMETELDNVSAGTSRWKALLSDYWSRFSKCCELAGNANPREVEKMLESQFGHILFARLPGDSRTCPSCGTGTLRLKVSRFGAGYFIGCDQHPKCKYIATSLFQEEDDMSDTEKKENLNFPPKVIGTYPGTDQNGELGLPFHVMPMKDSLDGSQRPLQIKKKRLTRPKQLWQSKINTVVLIKSGPYGFYIQLGEDNKGFTPKRAPLPNKSVNSLTLEDAVELLKYPIVLGEHPHDGQPVVLTISKAGFNVKHRNTIAPVPKTYDPKEITIATGLKILQSKKAKHLGRPKRSESTKPDLDKVLSDQLSNIPC